MFREQFPKILLVAQAYIGFQQVNPNTYGDHHLIKSHETVPLTPLFECKQPKTSKQFENPFFSYSRKHWRFKNSSTLLYIISFAIGSVCVLKFYNF